LTDLAALSKRVDLACRQLTHLGAQAEMLTERFHELNREIAALETTEQLCTQAAHVLTAIGEQRQDQAQRRIESLVTLGLQTIFGDELSFHLVQGVRAKNPVVDFVVRSTLPDGTTVDTDVMDARGGGLAAVVGFLLRVVILLLSHQRQDTVLLLDETFAHVSAEYLPTLIAFLRQLVQRTGVQIVMVTHEDTFAEAADALYRFTLNHGTTVVTRTQSDPSQRTKYTDIVGQD
jgi:glycerol-3-phosphate responsive antiterminator